MVEMTQVKRDDMMHKQIALAGNSMDTSINLPNRESFEERARTGTGKVL
jgi:hypothetical protein